MADPRFQIEKRIWNAGEAAVPCEAEILALRESSNSRWARNIKWQMSNVRSRRGVRQVFLLATRISLGVWSL